MCKFGVAINYQVCVCVRGRRAKPNVLYTESKSEDGATVRKCTIKLNWAFGHTNTFEIWSLAFDVCFIMHTHRYARKGGFEMSSNSMRTHMNFVRCNLCVFGSADIWLVFRGGKCV